MKTVSLFTCLLAGVYSASHSQTPGEWTWMNGDSVAGTPAVYGVKGVPDPNNHPGGIYEGCEWVDAAGNFYLYGGLDDNFQTQADLWKYSPSSNEWTWLNGPGGTGMPVYGMRGVASPANQPGDRGYGMLSWTDNNGNLWMYGGSSNTGITYIADFWKYNLSTNEWTWMGGDTTANSTGYHGVMGVPSVLNHPPPSTENACSWIDGDHLWFYGGLTQGGSYTGTLWRYSISTDEWTWMKGDSAFNAMPVYGTLGVSAPSNFPGARMCYSKWKDLNGDFWIFGGNTTSGYSNDLWRYSVSTNEWTWMAGPNVPYDGGFYLSKCISSTISYPAARFESRATWTDGCGVFWLFGGYGGGGQGDLWKYDSQTNIWTWISGTVAGGPSVYGTKGVSAPTNMPGGKIGSHSFMDVNGNLWILGGMVSGGMINDLWRYVPDPGCGACSSPVALFSADHQICPGACIDFLNNSLNATSYQWTFSGANPSTSTLMNPTNICYNTPGNYTVSLVATNANGSDTLMLNNFITVYPYPLPQGIHQSGDTLFANSGAVGYQWFLGGNAIPAATNYFYVAPQSGDYNVVATDSNGCEVEAAIFDVIAQVEAAENFPMFIYPNPVAGEFIVRSQEQQITGAIIFNMQNQIVTLITGDDSKPGEQHFNVSALNPGMYWMQVKTGKQDYRFKLIKL